MNELVEWLRVQLDEDERAALKPEARDWVHETTPDPSGPDHVLLIGERVVSAGFFEDDPLRPAEAEHMVRHDPARVLREIEAKRLILALCHLDFNEDGEPVFLGGYGEAYWDVVRLLALPYADRPGYRKEWRP